MKLTAKEAAKYWGCKCRYRYNYEFYPTPSKNITGEINADILHRLTDPKFECQLIGRRLSSITEEEAKIAMAAATELNTGKWIGFYKDHEHCQLKWMSDAGTVYGPFSIYFSWEFESFGDQIIYPAGLIDTLREMGFIEERYFESEKAIEE